MTKNIIVIAHNIRSTYNVGSIFRTSDGFGVQKVFLTGYTPYPASNDDIRLPHISKKISKQISKSALGAEKTVPWAYSEDIDSVIKNLKESGFHIAALEQSSNSKKIQDTHSHEKIAIIVGNEVHGLDKNTIKLCNSVIEIPMYGKKESFNVSSAVAIALYQVKVISNNKH